MTPPFSPQTIPPNFTDLNEHENLHFHSQLDACLGFALRLHFMECENLQ